MRMPCRCEIEPQYLPLNGGEREVTCEHAKWIVRGVRVVTTEIHVEKITSLLPPLEPEEDDDQGAGDPCSCGRFQFKHTVGDHAVLDRHPEGS